MNEFSLLVGNFPTIGKIFAELIVNVAHKIRILTHIFQLKLNVINFHQTQMLEI